MEAHYRSEARFHEESPALAEDSAEWLEGGTRDETEKEPGKTLDFTVIGSRKCEYGAVMCVGTCTWWERSASGRFTCALLPNADALATCTVFLHTCGWTNSLRMFQDWGIRARKDFSCKNESRKEGFFFNTSLRLTVLRKWKLEIPDK